MIVLCRIRVIESYLPSASESTSRLKLLSSGSSRKHRNRYAKAGFVLTYFDYRIKRLNTLSLKVLSGMKDEFVYPL
jgi:hypothetical protein